MVRADVITLISEAQPKGVFDTATETSRVVYCTIRSVGMNENYIARSQGLFPEVVFVLSDYAEYNNEPIVLWNDVRYKVIRTAWRGTTVELTVERKMT